MDKPKTMKNKALAITRGHKTLACHQPRTAL